VKCVQDVAKKVAPKSFFAVLSAFAWIFWAWVCVRAFEHAMIISALQ